MASSSLPWPFGRRGSKKGEKSGAERSKEKRRIDEEEELNLRELGVTEQLVDFVKGFTVDTFKSFPLQDDGISESTGGSDRPSTGGNVRKDLTEWQERHAVLVLSKVQEIAKLRYLLCPRHLKDMQFWRIYFLLVKNYIAPYEVLAIRKAKFKTMAMEDEKPKEEIVIEVEMAESNCTGPSVPMPCD